MWGRLIGAFRFLLVLPWILLVVLWMRLRRRPAHGDWSWLQEVVVRVVRWAVGRGRVVSAELLQARVPIAPRRFLPHGVRIEDGEVAGRPVETIVPREPGALTILYLHGGGYGVCSPATHRELIARLAHASGARCVALDYRLAPQHPYPAAVDDAYAAVLELLEQVPAERLLLAGDSAGGGLAVATLVRLKDRGDPMPAGAVLFSPWVDLTVSGATIDSNRDTDYLDRGVLELFSERYLCGHDPRSPCASPIYADLTGLPPLLVQAGGAEILCDEIETLASRATSAGVEVTLEVDAGMPHVHQGFARFMPAGRDALQRAGQWVRARA